MATQSEPSFFKKVDLKCRTNNAAHHTSEISEEKLIVRRGQPFLITVRLNESFNPDVEPLTFSAKTGTDPKQELGTSSLFGIPKHVKRSPTAKAVWEAELQLNTSLLKGVVYVNITPPADCPIGKYKMTIKYKKEVFKADVAVLFNPWCTTDSVFLYAERKKMEYVLNEYGQIYVGSKDYINEENWDFGQFEENMEEICFLLLDKSLSYQKDPSADVAARCDPVHVSRVITSMINSLDVQGVLEGRWGDTLLDYLGGRAPTHWTGSYAILKEWYENECNAVKYGQCWVFACVMCSVMRLLGVPSRVVTNFDSAHDTDRNLIIDMFHTTHGVEDRPSPDSIWNFHVWVECWFTRPDLAEHGNYDGWQVLDPTPQETSGGIHRCGPAPVKAIRKGQTDLKYDIPFVFAEVNADCVKWEIRKIGDVEEKIPLSSDTMKVGHSISTKFVNFDYRRDITSHYKAPEGSKEERDVFRYAATRDYSREDKPEPDNDEDTDSGEDEEGEGVVGGVVGGGGVVIVEEEGTNVVVRPKPDVTGRFEEVTQPINGNDVILKLKLRNEGTAAKVVVINISVQALRHNGSPAALIQADEIMKTFVPREEYFLDVVIPYKVYHEHMVNNKDMRIQALVSEKEAPETTFLAEFDVVLKDPPLFLSATSPAKLNQRTLAIVSFVNPVDETLTSCSLTMSGSGLFKEEFVLQLPDLKPGNKVNVKVFFTPHKKGSRVLMADFDCSGFRDIKASSAVTVIA